MHFKMYSRYIHNTSIDLMVVVKSMVKYLYLSCVQNPIVQYCTVVNNLLTKLLWITQLKNVITMNKHELLEGI